MSQIASSAAPSAEAVQSSPVLALIRKLGPERVALGTMFAVLAIMAVALPAAPFSIDNMLYIEMARAMAEHGSFSIAADPGVAPAEWLSISLTYGIDGGVYPQYPGGYALLAAPFYALMGVHGLAMMNVLAACAILLLTYRITMMQHGDRTVARLAAGLLALASFLGVYALGVWPHLVTLAMLLAGVERALCATQEGERRTFLNLGFAGLWFGLALNLRVDSMFPAAAVLVWLRLFALPSRRLAALAFVAGLAPGLMLASSVNFMKFGDLSPLSYGPTDGTDSVSGYASLMPFIVAAGVALMLIDASAPWVARCVGAVRTRIGALFLTVTVVAAIAIIPQLRQFAFNFYVLVFDLQQLEPVNWQSGVTRGAEGFISFWGGYKKALLQSLPWAGLMIAPVWAFMRGEQARAHALALGVIAAPVVFYSLNQWHGGYSFSMRYFLPVLPFVAILSAIGLKEALGEDRSRWRVFAMACAAVLAPGFLLVAPALSNPDYNPPWLHYYPAMAVLAGLAAASIVVVARPQLRPARMAQVALAGGAVGVAVLVNLFDVASFAHRKEFVATLNTHLARVIDEGALVLSVYDESLAQARAEGVGVMNPKTQPAEVVGDAISAYRLAGRCVYAYLDDTFDAMEGASRADWRLGGVPGVNGSLGALYQPVDQSADCDPQG